MRVHPGLLVPGRVRSTPPLPVEAKDRQVGMGGPRSLGHLASWSVPFPPGYGFLPPAQAEMLARQQELLRKQNLAR